jgi:hypothetical protein
MSSSMQARVGLLVLLLAPLAAAAQGKTAPPPPEIAAPSAPDKTAEAGEPAEAKETPHKRPATETKIEQRYIGGRVAEVIVSPAGTTYSYTMRNRIGQPPLSNRDLSSGLSTPSFFKYEF